MKKRISFILVLTLIFSIVSANSINVEAKDNTISDSTIVTENNIGEVLDYLNIEHDQFIINSEATKKLPSYTVADLKKVLKSAKSTSITHNTKTNVFMGEKEVLRFGALKKDKIVNKTLSRVDEHDGYSLEYSVYVKYNKTKKKFIETTGQTVEIDSALLPLVYKIDKKSLSSSCTDDTVTLKYTVNVGVYVGVANKGLIRIATQKIKGTQKWYAK